MVFTFGIMNASMPPLLFLRTDIESINNHHHPSLILFVCDEGGNVIAVYRPYHHLGRELVHNPRPGLQMSQSLFMH